jgi:hypothetical protein
MARRLRRGMLMDFDMQSTIRRETLQNSPDHAGATAYSLLDDGPALGSFSYKYQSEEWIADSAPFSHEVEPARLPFLQLNVGAWLLLVALSGSAISR